MEVDAIERGVETIRLESWTEFYDYCVSTMANSPAYVFRGQTDADWRIVSSLDRMEERFPTRPNFVGGVPKEFNCPPVNREAHFLAFKRAIRCRRGIGATPLGDDEFLALAQHHGLATPLIDWTLSPFVALYFAFEDAKRVGPSGDFEEPAMRAVYAMSSSVLIEVPQVELFSPNSEHNQRAVVQSGVFMKLPRGQDLESIVRASFPDESAGCKGEPRAILKKLFIPSAGRIDCLKALNKMNVNRMTLFPDLDGAARYINNMWELDFDTALGHISQ